MSEDKRVVVRRSRSEWQGIMSRFDGSGLSLKQFCVAEDLAPSTFALWRRRLGRAGPSRGSGEAALFVELAGGPAAAEWDAELDHGGGVVLRLRRARSC